MKLQTEVTFNTVRIVLMLIHQCRQLCLESFWICAWFQLNVCKPSVPSPCCELHSTFLSDLFCERVHRHHRIDLHVGISGKVFEYTCYFAIGAATIAKCPA